MLETAAERWIEPYWNAHHLVRTRDWLLELDPGASEALRIAALLHDCERMLPGGPPVDPALPPDDEEYVRAHSERSAQVAGDWLRRQGADDELVAEVRELLRLHEVGGSPAADLLQAADSLSFLEVNDELVVRWVEEGRATLAQSRAKVEYMYERIRPARARDLAAPLHARSLERLEAAAA
jgi:hypothetical protein